MHLPSQLLDMICSRDQQKQGRRALVLIDRRYLRHFSSMNWYSVSIYRRNAGQRRWGYGIGCEEWWYQDATVPTWR